jgi:hypothetical protein
MRSADEWAVGTSAIPAPSKVGCAMARFLKWVIGLKKVLNLMQSRRREALCRGARCRSSPLC